MDTLTISHKFRVEVRTWPGDWTAAQLDAGDAGPATETLTREQWYEPGPDGAPVEVTDPARIAELDARSRQEDHDDAQDDG